MTKYDMNFYFIHKNLMSCKGKNEKYIESVENKYKNQREISNIFFSSHFFFLLLWYINIIRIFIWLFKSKKEYY